MTAVKRLQSRPGNSLARVISKLGYCSRSQARDLIRDGRVLLNGRVARDPEMLARISDRIEIDGEPVKRRLPLYLVMNKPRGIVTTASDEKGRATVYDLLPTDLAGDREWVAPVGRLDKASEGLLLFTNDSTWAARITDPASHLDKTYHVQVDRLADDKLAGELMKGRRIDGELLRAKRAAVIRRGEKNSWLEVVLDEGKTRQIRRLLEAFEIEVLRLVRVSIGPLQLGELEKGAVRPLPLEGKAAIDRALGRNCAKTRS